MNDRPLKISSKGAIVLGTVTLGVLGVLAFIGVPLLMKVAAILIGGGMLFLGIRKLGEEGVGKKLWALVLVAVGGIVLIGSVVGLLSFLLKFLIPAALLYFGYKLLRSTLLKKKEDAF